MCVCMRVFVFVREYITSPIIEILSNTIFRNLSNGRVRDGEREKERE